MSERVEVFDLDLTDVQKEVQDTSKTLKELRGEVKDLRQQLENTEIGTEEFGKALSELTKKQQELTNVTKSGITAQKGSYNELVNQMAILKTEWRSTSDEAKRAALGEQISTINSQLKELDATVGNHQREVGNYRQALKGLKDELLNLEEGTEEYNQKLREAADIAQKMQDVNEEVAASAADLGDHLSNIVGTAAGISAGFQTVQATLNLIGVESENVTKMIATMQNVMALTQGLQTIEGSIKSLNRLTAAIKASNVVTTIMSALKKKDTAQTVAQTAAQNAYTGATVAATTATHALKVALITSGIGAIIVALGAALAVVVDKVGDWINTSKEAKNSTDDWKESMEELERSTGWLRSKEYVNGTYEYIKALKAAGNDTEKLKKLMEERKESSQKTYIKQLAEDLSLARKGTQAAQHAYEEYVKKFGADSDKAKEKFKDWQDAYQKFTDAQEKYFQESANNQEEVTKKIIESEDKVIEKKKESLKQEEENLKRRKEIQKELNDIIYNNSQNEIFDEYEKEKNTIQKQYDDSLAIWKKHLDDKLITEKEYGEAQRELNNRRLQQLQDLIYNKNKEQGEEEKNQREENLKEIEQYYANQLKLIDNARDDAYRNADIENAKNERTGEVYKIFENELDLLKTEQQLLQEKHNQLEQYKAELENAGADTSDVINQLNIINDELKMNIEKTETVSAEFKEYKLGQINGMIDGVKESVDALMALDLGTGLGEEFSIAFDAIQKGLSQTSDMLKKGGGDWSAYGQMAATGLNAASKILSTIADKQNTETEEGFEKQKKLQIAAATMAMLGGVVNAVTSAFSPQNAWMTIWGQAAAASAMSAMVLATGGMQIAQIKKQKFDGEGSTSGSNGIPALSALQMIDTGVQATTNIDGASVEGSVNDTRVYVVESDITSTQSTVKTTISEATF